MKLPIVNRIRNASFMHKFGNVLQSVCKLIDSLVEILSLGNFSSMLTMKFILFRFDTPFHDQGKNK